MVYVWILRQVKGLKQMHYFFLENIFKIDLCTVSLTVSSSGNFFEKGSFIDILAS